MREMGRFAQHACVVGDVLRLFWMVSESGNPSFGLSIHGPLLHGTLDRPQVSGPLPPWDRLLDEFALNPSLTLPDFLNKYQRFKPFQAPVEQFMDVQRLVQVSKEVFDCMQEGEKFGERKEAVTIAISITTSCVQATHKALGDLKQHMGGVRRKVQRDKDQAARKTLEKELQEVADKAKAAADAVKEKLADKRQEDDKQIYVAARSAAVLAKAPKMRVVSSELEALKNVETWEAPWVREGENVLALWANDKTSVQDIVSLRVAIFQVERLPLKRPHSVPVAGRQRQGRCRGHPLPVPPPVDLRLERSGRRAGVHEGNVDVRLRSRHESVWYGAELQRDLPHSQRGGHASLDCRHRLLA